MKNRVRCLLYSSFFIFYSSFAFAQQDSGFTNKAEAQNVKVNKQKDGKWIEYLKVEDEYESTTSDTTAPLYRLTIYKAGKAQGLMRTYYKSGKLEAEVFFIDGKQDGTAKGYYESGKLAFINPFDKGKRNGTFKGYYENGKVKMEAIYNNDKQVMMKEYDENGQEIQK
jgi:antitoxin component YwqK of YwqJK toxin-antitoxin module